MPTISDRRQDPVQKTTLLVAIATSPLPRRYTSYPGGLTLDGDIYTWRDLRLTGPAQSAEGSSRISATLTLGNSDNTVGDLATDLAQRSVVVTIKKVHFDEDWSIVGTETLFTGRSGNPRAVGELVEIVCYESAGRTGNSPRTTMQQVLATHTAPTTELKF